MGSPRLKHAHTVHIKVREQIRSGAAELRSDHVFYSFQESVDPERLKAVLVHVMMTFALAIASVTSTTAGAVTMGVSLGHLISSKVNH